MERLGREVGAQLGRFGPPEGDMVAIVRAWPAAVGETVARNAWPARLARDGTLLVHASSSTWAFELDRLAGTILDQLRAALRDAAPPALKFVPGPVPEPPSGAPQERPRATVDPSPEHAAEAARIAAAIEDEELRETVARAAAASLARASSEPSDSRRF
jgi:hypothetical protein